MIYVGNSEAIHGNGPWELPKGWKWVRLEDILKLEYGKALPENKRDVKGNYPVFGSGGRIGQHSSALTVAPVIVIGRKGSAGSLFFSPDLCWPIDTTYYADEFAANINPRYLYHFLKVLGLEKLRRSAPIPGLIRSEVLASLAPIPFPNDPLQSHNVQSDIVYHVESLLNDLERCKKQLHNMKSDIDLLMNAVLEEIFGKKRDQIEIKCVPRDEVKQIIGVAKIERGRFAHRPRNDPRFFGGSTPWIQIQNLPRDGSKYVTNYTNTLNEMGFRKSKLFNKGTLVISIAATIGAVGILSFDACFPDSLVGIMPDQSVVDVGFLYWQLLFFGKYLEKMAPYAAQKNINLEILRCTELWIPSLKEQRAIDAFLDAAQRDVNAMRATLDKDTKLLEQGEKAALEQAFGRTA